MFKPRRLAIEKLDARVLLAADSGVFCDKHFDTGGCQLLTAGPGGQGTGLSSGEAYRLITRDGKGAEMSSLGAGLEGEDPYGGGDPYGGHNEAPIVEFEGYEIINDLILSVDAVDGVLANDYDPDGGPEPMEALLYETPAHGAIVLNPDGSFVYDPVDSYEGDDYFSYQAWDGDKLSEVMSVYLVINGVEIEFLDGEGDPNNNEDWTIVTNTTTSVWVGEEINLRTKVTGIPVWNFPTAHEWMIPQRAIAWWGRQDGAGNFLEPNSQEAKVFEITQEMKDSPQPTFYFVDGGSKTVEMGVTLNNKHSVLRSTTFDVNRPEMTLSAATSEVTIFHSLPSQVMFAVNDPLQQGITFTANGDPSPGHVEFLQMVVTSSATRLHENGTGQSASASNVLDGTFPYGSLSGAKISPTQVVDSPDQPLETAFREYTRYDEFKMYLMWRSNRAGSIYVPLRSVDWWWSAHVVSEEGFIWEFAPPPAPQQPAHSQNPPDQNETEHPEWSGNVQSGFDFE